MTPALSEEQRRALQDRHGSAVFVEDTETHIQYVIIPADAYRRLQTLFEDDDFDIRETYAAQFAAMDTPECWDAPGMELYDDYDAHKQQS